jgi:hypothetical protein
MAVAANDDQVATEVGGVVQQDVASIEPVGACLLGRDRQAMSSEVSLVANSGPEKTIPYSRYGPALFYTA